MREVLAMQRRLQDLEHALRNMGRTGKVTDVKFDKEQNGWLAKMVQGEGDEAFPTDWLKWGSFSHGSIKMSIPPRKGQLVRLVSPQGRAEMGWLEPHHFDPDNVAPHDKPDEIFFRVEKPSDSGQTATDKDQTFDVRWTKDGPIYTIGKTTHKLTKDTQSVVTKNDTVDTETSKTKASQSHGVETKNASLETMKNTLKAVQTTINSASFALTGKTLINC